MAHNLVTPGRHPDVASRLLDDAAEAHGRLFTSPLTAEQAAAKVQEQEQAAIPTTEEHDMSKQLETLAATEQAAKVALDAATGARVKVESAESARKASVTAAWWAEQAAGPDCAGAPAEMKALEAAFTEAVRAGDGGEALSVFVRYKVRAFEAMMWCAAIEAATGQPVPVVSSYQTLGQLLDVTLSTVASEAGTAYRAGKLAELDKAVVGGGRA